MNNYVGIFLSGMGTTAEWCTRATSKEEHEHTLRDSPPRRKNRDRNLAKEERWTHLMHKSMRYKNQQKREEMGTRRAGPMLESNIRDQNAETEGG